MGLTQQCVPSRHLEGPVPPQVWFWWRFVFTLEDNKGNMHVSYALFANKEERENECLVWCLKVCGNNNSNVSLTKLLILLQNLWFTTHQKHASNEEQVKFHLKRSKWFKMWKTCKKRAGRSNTQDWPFVCLSCPSPSACVSLRASSDASLSPSDLLVLSFKVIAILYDAWQTQVVPLPSLIFQGVFRDTWQDLALLYCTRIDIKKCYCFPSSFQWPVFCLCVLLASTCNNYNTVVHWLALLPQSNRFTGSTPV